MQVSFDNAQEFLDAYAGNVGVGGLMLRTAADFLTVGSRFQVSFQLPGTDHQIRATAAVVWRHEPGSRRGGDAGLIGLGFRELGETDKGVIADYVSQRARL